MRARLASARGIFSGNFEDTLGRTWQRCSEKISGRTFYFESAKAVRVIWYFFFFLVSGFCGILYELVWLRLAMAQFGVTTPLVSTVLSMFMAGLGFGSGAGRLFVRAGERATKLSPLAALC